MRIISLRMVACNKTIPTQTRAIFSLQQGQDSDPEGIIPPNIQKHTSLLDRHLVLQAEH